MNTGDVFEPSASDMLVAYAETLDSKESVNEYRHASGSYSVVSNGKIRHANGNSEDVMRALSFYLQSYMNTTKRN